MSTSYPQKVAVRFGEFEFDHSGEMHSGARKIKLQEQPSQILRILLERAGEIVTREELRRKMESLEPCLPGSSSPWLDQRAVMLGTRNSDFSVVS